MTSRLQTPWHNDAVCLSPYNVRRHRHRPQHARATGTQEFVRFLNTRSRRRPCEWRSTPSSTLGDLSTNILKVQKWLARHPRLDVSLHASSASWLQAVEGFLSPNSRRPPPQAFVVRLGRVARPQAAINRFVEETNSLLHPKLLRSTATPNASSCCQTKKIRSDPLAHDPHKSDHARCAQLWDQS